MVTAVGRTVDAMQANTLGDVIIQLEDLMTVVVVILETVKNDVVPQGVGRRRTEKSSGESHRNPRYIRLAIAMDQISPDLELITF